MKSILLVEDDAQLRSVLKRGLLNAGHAVVAPDSSTQALRLLAAEDFDLLVTDVVLPDIDGLDLIRRARKMRPDQKVIAISGGGVGTGGQYLELAKRFGAVATLEKPFPIEDLIAAVAAVG